MEHTPCGTIDPTFATQACGKEEAEHPVTCFVTTILGLLQLERVAVVMRGVPGSGKSTVVSRLEKAAGAAEVCSADKFFIQDGAYQFDFRLLPQAHAACKQQFHEACENRVPLVLLDNTCTRSWEYQDYKNIACAAGYTVMVVELREERMQPRALAEALYKRNKHGVPLAKIEEMLQRWEEDPEAIKLPIQGIAEEPRCDCKEVLICSEYKAFQPISLDTKLSSNVSWASVAACSEDQAQAQIRSRCKIEPGAGQ